MSDLRDTSLDHRTVDWAIDILTMCEPIRCVQGGMWFGRNHNFADATFIDFGVADAFAVAAKELPTHVAEIASFRAQLAKQSTDLLAMWSDWKVRALKAEAQLARARKALEVVKSMIRGEALEHAVVDTTTMTTLGEIVETSLSDDQGTS